MGCLIITILIDAIIGNPPYQIMDGGAGASAKPVYNLFVDIAKRIYPHYISLIMPARWYAGGKGLDSFREQTLNDQRIREIYDYPNPKDCFPNTNISGGICYFLYDSTYEGNCYFHNIINGYKISKYRKLNEYEVFIRYNDATSILNKLSDRMTQSLVPLVSTRNAFGIASFIRGESHQSSSTDLLVHSSKGIGFLRADEVSNGLHLIPKYKLLVGKVVSGHLGETDNSGKVKVIGNPIIAKPYEVTTDSYIVVGGFQTEEEILNLRKYFYTKILRFLLLQSLTSMNITRERFQFVPLQDFTDRSDIDWSKSIAEIDQQLYAKYGLSREEITFIESKIKPME